ncbi:MAG: potassium/proton antiporter, partial [Alphaproteobacteria bacterium]|nr:potassium/proton antiporter [Alphaproteobacteria bacterium]
ELLLVPQGETGMQIARLLVLQGLGGALFGFLGGRALAWLINRVELAPGLYPVLALTGAVVIFAGANALGASGFLAVYLAGLILGRRHLRAHTQILRFQDGFSWLTQVVLFLLLGLLARPSQLATMALAGVLIGLAVMMVARPASVIASLLAFRFDWREKAFISWMGLRGAVPIFLASIPVLAGLERGSLFVDLAFVAVLLSLVVQGWTVAPVARLLGLLVPPPPAPVGRGEIDLPSGPEREVAGYRVAAGSPALRTTLAEIALPGESRLVGVIRKGAVVDFATIERLAADDFVLLIAPPADLIALDRLFAPPARLRPLDAAGEFVLDGHAPVAALAAAYGLPLPTDRPDLTLDAYLRERLRGTALPGDRLRVGDAWLVVRATDGDVVTQIGLEVEEDCDVLPILRLKQRAADWLTRVRRRGGGAGD